MDPTIEDAAPPAPPVAPAAALYTTTDEVRALVAAFEATTLPYPQWTHAAHLTVAVCYLAWYGPDAALDRVRDAIRRYNAVHAHHPMRVGYHETITRFWLGVVRRRARELPRELPLATVANLVVAGCTNRELPLTYYSRDRLFSDEARHGWLEPDLRRLDE